LSWLVIGRGREEEGEEEEKKEEEKEEKRTHPLVQSTSGAFAASTLDSTNQ
jgi:hypothetical protein